MTKPKVLVFAYSQLGYDCLKFLIESGENIIGVFTHANNPNETIWFSSTEELAKQHNIPVYMPESPNTLEMLDLIQTLQPDLILSFYYRNLICQKIIDLPRLGAFNMHGSFLPKYRGRCPVNWAILHGETETGVTLHWMVKAADAGDIVDQEVVEIEKEDNAGDVTLKLNTAAVAVLKRQIEKLKKGDAAHFVQDVSAATYFGGRTPKDSLIIWQQSSFQVYNLIRALMPYPQYPSAFTIVEDRKLLVMKSKIGAMTHTSKPGEIIEIRRDENEYEIQVACGTGIIHLTSIEWENFEKDISLLPSQSAINHLSVGQVLG
jgi:methionyl-tRNA formyltransferase